MSESKVRRAFRTTKIKVNKDTVPASEQRDQLEALFISLEAAKTDAVASERKAGIAAAKAKTMNATAQVAELEFLQTASTNFPQVAGERLWIIYRDTDGTIVLEGFTERLIRNNMRAQQDLLGNQIENSSSDSNVDRSGLYEAEDEDESQGPDPDAN